MNMIDRKDYWNKNYAEYWKKVTDEAEEKGSSDSSVKKISGHDFKSPGIEVITDFFDKIQYSNTDKLLDYGCGLGRFFPYFSHKCSYFGIDISSAMIDECVKKWPDRKDDFLVAEGENLPFECDFFDHVICNGVFDACFQERALKEMFRVCKIGGDILISGKNDLYFSDDEEAYVAEVNARKKSHPNFFTNVGSMIRQIEACSEIVAERYALRRGDFAKGTFEYTLPAVFYEWEIIIKKIDVCRTEFERFSSEFSVTWEKRDRQIIE